MDKPPELMSDAELVDALDRCDADVARIETRRLRLIAAMDKSGYAERVGARDMVQYIEFRYRLDHSRAYRDVKLSRALPKYAAVTAALPGPESPESPVVLLRPAQAEAIVFGLEKVPTTVPVEDLEFAEQELVRQARYLAPADLRKAAEQSRDILDTDGPEPAEDKAAARETLTLKAADHGVKFTGYLANENAELFRTLVFTGARPHKTLEGERDPRSREKRQADALTTTLTLAATALDAGIPSPTVPHPTSTPPNPTQTSSTGNGSTETDSDAAGSSAEVPGFGAKANLTVTIDLEDLKAATADAIGQTVYSNGLSAATIRRLACDAGVIPVVLGSNSEPVDVGRRERLVTKAIRRALNTRDRGCVICNAPPIICDAHHLTSWIDGGHTNTNNLALVCRRHHTDLHHGHWTITITIGQVHVTRPTWADPPPHHPHTPPDNPSWAHEPPGERPTPTDPPDDASRAQESPGECLTRQDPSDDAPREQEPPGDASRAGEPPGERPMRPDPADGGLTSTGDPRHQTSAPADDPWGETTAPAASAAGVRPSRWHADESTRTEAARFAVWGAQAPNDADTGPPSFATI